VTITKTDTGSVRVVVTDERGHYRAAALPPGPYELKTELSGFETVLRKGLTLSIGEEVTLAVTLSVGRVNETVTITAAAPIVEISKNAIGGTVSRAQLDNLPIPARDYTQLANTAPGIMGVASPGFGAGITTGSTVAGAGQLNRNNTFMIDGVSNNDLISASSRGGISLEAVQEYAVQTSQFSAESGQASGAVVSVVTRSGTNQLQGRAFLFARPNALNALDYFSEVAGTAKAPFSQQQFGGFVGGPVVKDKLHYFGAYEMLRIRQSSVITSPLVPVDQRQNPFNTNQHQPFTKFDWQPNGQQTVSIRYRLDQRTQIGGGIGGLNTRERGWDSDQRSQDFGASHTAIFSARTLNELRITYQPTLGFFDSDPYAPSPNAPQINRPSGGFGKLFVFPQHSHTNYTRIVDNFSYTVAAHNIKAGTSVELIKNDSYFLGNKDGTFTFTTDAAFNPGDRATYPIQYTQTQGDWFQHTAMQAYGFFVQDSWRLLRTLTVNAGLRYDFDTAWSHAPSTRTADASTGYTPIAQEIPNDMNNVGPRVGFAWDPAGNGKTAIRGGFGLYFDKTFLNVPGNVTRATISTSITITNPGYPDPYAGGSVTPSRPSTLVADGDMQTPLSRSVSIGAEREIVSGVGVAADYVRTLADNLLLTYDVNYPSPVTRARPNAAYLAISRFQTTGRAWSDALLLRLDRRTGPGPTFGVSYTFSKADRDTEDFQFIAQDMNNLAGERGPANNDRRHQLVSHVVYRLPLDFQIGAYFSARSGLPFTVTTGRDNNADTNINDRPDLVNPSGNPLERSTYDFTFTGHTGNLARNSARGPAFAQLDVRASKYFRFGSKRVEAFFEAFNITDRVNFATPVGNLASAAFGRPTALGGSPRQGEFGFRFDF
jgi:carboxypeptidase family protein